MVGAEPFAGTFNQYSPDRFGDDAQKHLRDQLVRWVGRGVHVLASNADTPEIRELYSEGPFQIVEVDSTQTVSAASASRVPRRDLIIIGRLD